MVSEEEIVKTILMMYHTGIPLPKKDTFTGWDAVQDISELIDDFSKITQTPIKELLEKDVINYVKNNYPIVINES